jgi:P pilus assembly chaperone PapD
LTFGNQSVGGLSAPQTVTVTNPSLATVKITGIYIDTGFAQTNNCGTSIAPQSSCTFNVSSKPTGAGHFSGQLSLADNATNSSQVITLDGKGNNGKGH